jgi:hypothetical protein
LLCVCHHLNFVNKIADCEAPAGESCRRRRPAKPATTHTFRLQGFIPRTIAALPSCLALAPPSPDATRVWPASQTMVTGLQDDSCGVGNNSACFLTDDRNDVAFDGVSRFFFDFNVWLPGRGSSEAPGHWLGTAFCNSTSGITCRTAAKCCGFTGGETCAQRPRFDVSSSLLSFAYGPLSAEWCARGRSRVGAICCRDAAAGARSGHSPAVTRTSVLRSLASMATCQLVCRP